MIENLKPLSKQCTQNILNQMNNNLIGKIIFNNNNIFLCFFTKIKYKTRNILVMITNYQIINYTVNNNDYINVYINNNLTRIEFEKIKYFNKEYNLAVIQIKENNNINYFELDEYLYLKESESFYYNESIYILNYNNKRDITVTYGIIKHIINSEIIYSSYLNKNNNNILPIFNLSNNKLIGIFTHNNNYINKGLSFKFIITKIIKEYNIIKLEKNEWNEINIYVNLSKNDKDKKIYFLDKGNNNKKLDELNNKNTELFINNKKYEFNKYLIPNEEDRIYNIKLKFNINLTDTSYMFAFCENITKINFISINTKFITTMKYMFHKCKNLKYVNLLPFDTRNVIDMTDMFSFCKRLNNLDLSSFDINNAINISYMFYYCYRLNNLTLFSFNSQNNIDMDYLLDMCVNLKLGTHILKNNKKVNKYLNEISILISIEDEDIGKSIYFLYFDMLNKINTELYINDKRYEFTNYFVPGKKGEYNINLKFKINLTDSSNMFAKCKKISEIHFIRFNSSNIRNMNRMFYECENLQDLDLTSFDTKNVTNMSGMFGNCSNLNNLNLSSFDTKNVTNMNGMFGNCSNLNNLNLSSFDTKNVTDMGNMFRGCNRLNNLDLSSFVTTKTTNMSFMFAYCCQLNNLNISSFDTNNVADKESMFYGCPDEIIKSNKSKLNKLNEENLFDW